MPQMSPMLWFNLYMYFILLLLLVVLRVGNTLYYIWAGSSVISSSNRSKTSLLYSWIEIMIK